MLYNGMLTDPVIQQHISPELILKNGTSVILAELFVTISESITESHTLQNDTEKYGQHEHLTSFQY